MNKQMLAYLQKDQIGKVIAKGLANVYTQQPKTPIKFLAHWLKNYSQNQKQLKRLQQNARTTQTNLKIYESNLQLQAEQLKARQIQKQKYQQKIEQFKKMIESHEYQEQLLAEELPQFIQKLSKFTGVYIGQLNYPKKDVTEEDTEPTAHLEMGKQKLINYIGSSKSHKSLMIGKTLPLTKGVTAKAFQLSLQEPPQQIAEDGTPIPQQKTDKCVYISNVVKNQNVHYFRLPKLGAYIAIPLIYNSYLTQKIFDQALDAKKKEISSHQQFEKGKTQALQAINKQIQQNNIKINQLKQKNAQESLFQPLNQQIQRLQKQKAEKQAQVFQPEVVELATQKRQYVFCADNLGCDKQIPQKQRQFLIQFILHFKKSWQKKQYQLLYKDVQTQVKYENQNLNQVSVEDLLKNIALQFQLEQDPQTKQKMEAIEDQNLRNYKIQGWKVQKLKNYILNNEKFINSFMFLKDFRIVKYKQLIQNILYFQGRRKSEINIKNKAIIDWKNVRKTMMSKQLFNNILAYVIEESKAGQYPPYSKINSIIEKLESFDQVEVFNYNIGLGMLRKYILLALKHRIQNIELRKVQRQNQRKKRQQIIAENQKITQEKVKALENHKATLPAEEVESFSQEQWQTKYNEEHPLLEVPPEVIEDIDNDF